MFLMNKHRKWILFFNLKTAADIHLFFWISIFYSILTQWNADHHINWCSSIGIFCNFATKKHSKFPNKQIVMYKNICLGSVKLTLKRTWSLVRDRMEHSHNYSFKEKFCRIRWSVVAVGNSMELFRTIIQLAPQR